jgi:hypothetical protein
MRQRVITALKSALATIKTTNQYETTISAKNIREWETYSVEDLAGISGIVITLKDSEQVTEMAFNADYHELTVELEAYMSGNDAIDIMRKFAADLITFTQKNRTLAGLVNVMDLDEVDNTELYHDKQKIAVYRRNILITYTTENYNAYN